MLSVCKPAGVQLSKGATWMQMVVLSTEVRSEIMYVERNVAAAPFIYLMKVIQHSRGGRLRAVMVGDFSTAQAGTLNICFCHNSIKSSSRSHRFKYSCH